MHATQDKMYIGLLYSYIVYNYIHIYILASFFFSYVLYIRQYKKDSICIVAYVHLYSHFLYFFVMCHLSLSNKPQPSDSK